MTLTSRAMEWLNQNRHRAYPMESSEWRGKFPADLGLDCVVLDALVCDCGASGSEEMSMESISVGHDSTTVCMKYGGHDFSVILTGGEIDGSGSFECMRYAVRISDSQMPQITLVMSSHAYIREAVGEGTWDVGCRVLMSRLLRLSDGSGVACLSVNGSTGVEGYSMPAKITGDVVLEDGYRTSPVVESGRVLVRVGRRYGKDPCQYDFGEEGHVDCRKPLFFFCGQNAINSGNVNLNGGLGISVSQGGLYEVRSGTCKGKKIPCVEIRASREVMDMYRP